MLAAVSCSIVSDECIKRQESGGFPIAYLARDAQYHCHIVHQCSSERCLTCIVPHVWGQYLAVSVLDNIEMSMAIAVKARSPHHERSLSYRSSSTHWQLALCAADIPVGCSASDRSSFAGDRYHVLMPDGDELYEQHTVSPANFRRARL